MSCSALPPTWPTFANRRPASTSATPGALRSQAAPAGTLRDQVSCRPARGVAAPRRASVCESQSQGHMLSRIVWKKSHLGSARPSSSLAFFHDRPSRRSAARIVSRQHSRPNRSRTKPARRLSVQRGFGSAPATGGLAACRCAARTSSPTAAAMSGQRGGGHRCAGRVAPQGRAHCKHAATPSPSGGGGPSVQRRPWRSRLAQCHAGEASARGCGDGQRSGPGRANPPASGPSAHDQHATPVSTKPQSGENRCVVNRRHPTKEPKPSVSNWTRFSSPAPPARRIGTVRSCRPPRRSHRRRRRRATASRAARCEAGCSGRRPS